MATRKANPPPQQVPAGLADRDPDLFKYLEDQQFFNFQIWKIGIQNILDVDVISGGGGRVRALTTKVQNQIGSGQFLTCDDSGFTCDSDHFTCDMSEA